MAHKFYSKEEEKELFRGYWADGEERMVTIVKVPWESASGKKISKLKCFDVVACAEKEEVNFDLQASLRAMEFEKEFKEGVSVLKVTPTKTGEREYNGNTYDEFSFAIEETPDEYEAPQTAEASGAVEDVDF